ncbi:MAG: DNA-binding transcriptional LysR family regulator [Oceanospirillaceae bacterium]|jgi:DNA-binding transcriptional LysR family regulator
MRLDTESLRTLKTTIELGSLTIAAGQLNITPSAVSWKLKRLETRVGRKLIHRNGHHIEPTTDALQLLDYAEIILNAHDRAVQQFRLSDISGKLVIGITDDLASNQLPIFVQNFHRCYPNIQLEIRVEQQLALIEWFNDRSIDIAILPLEQSHIRDTDIQLWQEDLIWVKSKEIDYCLSKPLPLVTFSPNCTYRAAALECLEEHNVDFYISMECPSLAGVRAIVSSGMGVTLINKGLMTDDQCEWPESKRFNQQRQVKFVIRATPLIPKKISELVITQLKSFLPS